MTDKQFEAVETLLKRSPRGASSCPTCGAKAIEVAPGILEWQPSTYRWNGEDVPCDCETQRAYFRHYLLANISEEYMRLDKDDYIGDPGALEEMFSYLENWPNYRDHGMGLGFYSEEQGTGKTFLATYVGRELIKRGESVYFQRFREIVNTFELPYEDRSEEEARLRESTVLILDEIGTSISEAQHAFFAEKLEELIRHRSSYNRITIITTNLEPDELDKEYPRTFSLLNSKQKHIVFNGGDVRRGSDGIYTVNEGLALNGETRPIK